MGERTLKVLATIGFVLITGLALTAGSSSARAYEISIYTVYPWWFWWGIVATYALGTILILYSIRVAHRTRYLALGVSIILFANAFLLFMPMIRGYFAFFDGDAFTHRGHVLDLAETGHVASGNFYPAVHIHALMGMYLTGLGFLTFKNVITPAFSLVYWLGFLILARRLTDDPSAFHYAVPFVLLPVLKRSEIYFGPHVLSFALYPVLLYALFRVRRSRNHYLAIVVIIFVFLTFTHPITTMVSVLTIGLVGLSKFTSTRLQGRRVSWKHSFPILTIPLVIVVVFFAWYYSFTGILYMTAGMVASLLVKTGTSQIEEYSNALETVPVGIVDFFELVIFRKGSEIVLVLLAMVSTAYLLNRVRQRTDFLRWEHLFAITSFGVFSIISALFLVNPIMLTWTRFLKYVQFFGVLLVALAAYAYHGHADGERRNQTLVAVGLVVLLLTSLLVFGFFDSHLQRRPTDHVPESRVEGMEWFIDHRNASQPAYGFSYRYEHMLLGVEPNERSYTERQIPEHFGYHNATTFATPNRTGSYLIVTEELVQWYPTFHPNYRQYWQFTPADFRRLERDRGLQKIYVNGDAQVYTANSSETINESRAMTREDRLVNVFAARTSSV